MNKALPLNQDISQSILAQGKWTFTLIMVCFPFIYSSIQSQFLFPSSIPADCSNFHMFGHTSMSPQPAFTNNFIAMDYFCHLIFSIFAYYLSILSYTMTSFLYPTPPHLYRSQTKDIPGCIPSYIPSVNQIFHSFHSSTPHQNN